MKANVIEIEVNGGNKNRNLIFPPLGARLIRGRFDPARAMEHDKEANSARSFHAGPIPGQVLGLDLDAQTGYIRDPLADDPEHEVLREKIKRKSRLPPAREEFPNPHVPTWLHWFKRAVEDGICTVVAGKLPDDIDGEVQLQTPFAKAMQTHKDPIVKLTEAIEKQTSTFERVLLELLKAKK